MRGAALLFVLLALLRCADSVSAFLSINTEALSSASSAAVKPYLRIREVQRGTTGNPREDGTDLQHIAVSLAHRTNPSVNDILIDSIDHVDSGLYRVTYKPIVSGQYDASITIKGDKISTNLSNGLSIRPARADAIKSTHNASPLVTEGIDETFTIQAIDRFGNELWSELPSKEDEFLVKLKGAPHVCSGREGDAIAHPADLEYSPEVGDVEADAESSGSGGLYKASYTPTLAGTHQVSIRLRSVGGLLGTYFRNADFTRPAWGNSDHVLNSHPANIPWCEPDVVECDSTRLDTNVMFDWGFGSPLRVAPNDNDDDDDDDDNKFPIDSFSAKWVGELKVPATDEYTFFVTLNGQAKLMVGESVLIDTMANPSQSKTVSSETIELVVDTFYPITMEYIHHTVAVVIGALFWNLGYSTTYSSIQSRIALLFYCVAFFVFMSVAVLPFTVIERAIVNKEVKNGYYHPALYHAAQALASLPGTALLAFLTTLIIITMTKLNAPYWYFLNMFLALNCAEALAQLVSHVVPHFIIGMAGVAAVSEQIPRRYIFFCSWNS